MTKYITLGSFPVDLIDDVLDHNKSFIQDPIEGAIPEYETFHYQNS